MSQGTLALDAAFQLATAGLYAYVGALVRSRATGGEDARLANRMFVVWWLSLAVSSVMTAARELLAAAGVLDMGIHLALSLVGVVALVALLWGLTYYLAFIYTGRRELFAPIAVAYAALLAAFLYLVWWLQPTGVVVEEWTTRVEYARQAGTLLNAVLLFTILGPVLLLSIGYATLYFRTRDRTARYRIALVSGAFILWFGSAALGASIAAINEWSAWPVASRAIGIVSTLMILAAYKPPRSLRERMGIRDVRELPDEPRSLSDPRTRSAPPAAFKCLDARSALDARRILGGRVPRPRSV